MDWIIGLGLGFGVWTLIYGPQKGFVTFLHLWLNFLGTNWQPKHIVIEFFWSYKNHMAIFGQKLNLVIRTIWYEEENHRLCERWRIESKHYDCYIEIGYKLQNIKIEGKKIVLSFWPSIF
jgi:hypothetical protein